MYRLLALRYLLQRWDRGALIVASIALGVATLVSARILNQCIEVAAQDTTTPGASAELYVTNGEAGVRREVADDLRAAHIPGVKSVQPLVFERVSLPDLDGRVAVLVGAEVSTQLLTADNPLKAKVEVLATAPKLQLLPVWAAVQEGDFKKHPKQQLALLHAAARLVAPGGRLVYSTCSIDAAENERVITEFFNSRAGGPFKLERTVQSLPWVAGHDGSGAFLLRRQ